MFFGLLVLCVFSIASFNRLHHFKYFMLLVSVFAFSTLWHSDQLSPIELRMCSALLDKATIGYIVPEYFKWPGFLSPSMGLKFSDVPNGLAAIGKVPGNGWAQIVAFAGYY